MDWEWHPASVSKRAGRCYVSVTIPVPARPAYGGQKQLRRSAGTTDSGLASKRRHDIEAKLREEIVQRYKSYHLKDDSGPYQAALAKLGVSDQPYTYEFVQAANEPFQKRLNEPPTSQRELADLERALADVLSELQAKLCSEDPLDLIHLHSQFNNHPPSEEEAEALVSEAIAEARSALGIQDERETLGSFLPKFQAHNDRQAEQGNLKRKTAKQTTTHVAQFIELVGDKPLEDVTSYDGYSFAEYLSETYSNSTIKTRVSDVRRMLTHAETKGLLQSNPLRSLRLSKYGKGTKHYTPLSDEQLHQVFSIPGLPEDVRDLWAILICTGMRIDEAATLHRNQIKQREGIDYFDLSLAQVKNEGSQRSVPICHVLRPLIKRRISKLNNQEQLLDYKIDSDGKTKASRQCTYWLDKLDLNSISGDRNGWYTTHSLRGTFKDKLRDAGISQEINDAITGHNQHTVSAGYGRGPGLPAMKKAVDKANHPYLNWIGD